MTLTARIRPLLLALLAMLACCAAPALAADQGLNGAKDNEAVAQPTGAGDSVIDLAFSVRETASDVVDETNTAVAYANCEACRAVAIAFQIVIVQGSPSTVTPQNVAVAVNDQCPDCSTLALAYQFVVGRGEPVEFTRRGLARLAAVRVRLALLERQYGRLTNEQIRARTDAFAEEIRDILANDLVPAGTSGRRGQPIDRDETAQDDRGDPTATTTTPAPPQPQPEPTPQPAPEPAPAEPPAPEPAPTETTPPATTTPAPAEDPASTTTQAP